MDTKKMQAKKTYERPELTREGAAKDVTASNLSPKPEP